MSRTQLQLSRSELVFLLSFIGFNSLYGQEDLIPDNSQQQSDCQIEDGMRSLSKRGLLAVNDSGVVLDDFLIAFVGACIRPEATFLLTHYFQTQTNVFYFYVTSYIIVKQFQLSADVFVFEFIPDVHTLEKHIAKCFEDIDYDGVSEPSQSITLSLSEDTFAQLINFCLQKTKTSISALLYQEAGWDDDTIELFEHTCNESPLWIGVVAWNLRSHRPNMNDPLIGFQGEKWHWIVEFDEKQTLLNISPVDKSQFINYFLSSIDPIKTIFH